MFKQEVSETNGTKSEPNESGEGLQKGEVSDLLEKSTI
jgi:hypothetical protein